MNNTEFLKIIEAKLVYLPNNQDIKNKIIALLNETLFGVKGKILSEERERLLRYGLEQ